MLSLRDRNAVDHGILLEYLTIGWNVLEGVVATVAGLMVGSVALIGFGIDSGIESASGGILLWRLTAERRGQDAQALERRALKLVAISFFFLAAYVAFGAARTLVLREKPETSIVGMALSVLSLIVMPLLARAKRKTAARLDSRALQADSRQTSICGYLSAILLGGLLLNATLGWWWADPVAATVMVPIILHEGRQALTGENCTNCS